MPNLTGVPADVASALDQLRDELARAAGDNLAGLILYGGLARGRYRAGRSDVNVVVLLHDASADALTAIAPALGAASRAAGVEPLLMTPVEVERFAQSFPTKFLDIKDHHVVLAGVDPFTNVEPTREQILQRSSQALHNLLLRMRRGYIAAGTDTAAMARSLARFVRPLAIELEALARAAGHAPPVDDRSAAVFETASAALRLEAGPLKRLADLRSDPALVDDVPALFRDVLDVVARAADIAEEMRTPR